MAAWNCIEISRLILTRYIALYAMVITIATDTLARSRSLAAVVIQSESTIYSLRSLANTVQLLSMPTLNRMSKIYRIYRLAYHLRALSDNYSSSR
jgi:hypothetical protein